MGKTRLNGTEPRVLAVYPAARKNNGYTHLIRVLDTDGVHYGWYVYDFQDELAAWMWVVNFIRDGRMQLPSDAPFLWEWEGAGLDAAYPLPELEEVEDGHL